jgi:CRISPR system Cascade subunit CasD
MSTLLLRFAAPLQSWGVDSKFDRRSTGRSPSKSGVVGLCAAALGIRRNDADADDRIAEIAKLKFGVRIDKPGKLIKDFHMAHGEAFWDPKNRTKIDRGKKSKKSPKDSKEPKNDNAYRTNRYYLSDAVFLVGLEGDEDLLQRIDKAINSPMFPLYLGRRSCPPEGQMSLKIVPDNIEEALEKWPLLASSRRNRRWHSEDDSDYEPLTIVIDSDSGCDFRSDFPISFSPMHRKYDSRFVNEYHVLPPATGQADSEHDAFAELEAEL